MFYESDVCYQTKLVTKLVKDAFFEAVAKNGYVLLSANRFPRENSQGVYITPEWYSVRRIFFSFLCLSFSLLPSNTAVPTNCKSCASKRTKRHEESVRILRLFDRSLVWIIHDPASNFPSRGRSTRLRKPTWPLVFFPIFSFETCSRPPVLGRWILIIVRPIPLLPLSPSQPIIWIPRMLFEPRSKRIFFMYPSNTYLELDRWESSSFPR